MNVLVLLGCFALASCALGVLGIARVSKDRRGLQRFERECLLALDPLSLPPHKSQQQQQHNARGVAVATAVRSLVRKLISSLLPLLAPSPPQVVPTERVEQGPSPATPPAIPSAAERIWDFVRQAALQLSGLSLLMANQHELPSAKAAVVVIDKSQSNSSAEHGQHASKIHEGTRGPQPTWTDEDADQYDSFEGDGPHESDSTSGNDGASSDSNGDDGDDEGDDADEDEIFEDPFEQDKDGGAEPDAQRVLFDGLQFYTVLSQVGAATVQSVVQQALLNTIQSAATKQLEERQQASISAIEQRYPDIMCLSAPSYHLQHTTRADLATALLAVTAAAMQQSQQQQQQHSALHCGTMERRVSIKRPDALALAAEDGMEPMRRTPHSSPAASSSSQLETSFLQAA